MDKDFDRWNKVKKSVNQRLKTPFCNAREIWWCSLGLNVGSEEDGKNDLFERPVLILKTLSKETSRIVPLTTRLREDMNNVIIVLPKGKRTVKLSQIRTISNKRLTRKIHRLADDQFNKIVQTIINSLV